MNGRRRSDEERQAIREAYFALPRTDGLSPDQKGRKRKGRGGRVAPGCLQPLLKRFGITEAILWKIVYREQPWNQS